MRPIATLAAALALALVPLSAPALAATAQEDDDKVVLANEHITVWFQGKKPMLKVFPTVAGEANGSAAYELHFKDVVEYRDVDADGVPSNAEILARLDLGSASSWEVNETAIDGGVVLNLTLEAPVKIAGGVLPPDVTVPDRTARVAIVFTLRDAAATVDMAGEEVVVAPSSVKFDLVVERWPSVDAENARLALDLRLVGAVDDRPVGGLDGAAVFDANGTEIGAFSWVSLAEGVDDAGAPVDVPVRAEVVRLDGEGQTRVVFTYDAPGLVRLLHDPVIGVATSASLSGSGAPTASGVPSVAATPGAGVLLATLALAGVALVAARRRA